MSGFDIVLVIALILFARLGVRLVSRYIRIRKDARSEKQDKDASSRTEP